MTDVGSVDLSVIIVNYNVSDLVLQAVESVSAQRFAGSDGRNGRFEIVVIDNASRDADAAMLERLPPSVAVIRNRTNLGFAAANNQGIERARGRYVCLLNPDTRLLDGSVEALRRCLDRHPGAGMVGPRIWADDERTLQLPPGDPPSLSFLIGRALGEAIPSLRRRRAKRWCREAIRFWRAEVPMTVTMLSGACLMVARETLRRVGGFDPGFFLYYEDADLCRRIRRQGLRLVVVPAAEVVHYYNQSAQADPHGAWSHAMVSERRFVRVHYGPLGAAMHRATTALGRRTAHRSEAADRIGVIDLGAVMQPPRFELPVGSASEQARLWQISPDRWCAPSAGAFVTESTFSLSRAVWDRLMPGRYYVQAADPDTCRALGCWSWIKPSPSES